MNEATPRAEYSPKQFRYNIAAGVAALGLVASLSSCGESTPPEPTLECTVFLLTAMGGNQSAQIIPREGSDFAKELHPENQVKDIVVNFNDRSADGRPNDQHTELNQDFSHQFIDYSGITHRIIADVLPVDGSKYSAGHCEAAFEFANAPALTF